MSAIEQALDRGRKVSVRDPKWEPDHVDYPGRLVVGLRNTDSGNIERIEVVGGRMVHRDYGKLPDGTVQVHTVRPGELKRRAEAMMNADGDELDELIREAWATFCEKSETHRREVGGTKVKRGAA